MAKINMMNNFGIDLDDIDMTDEFGTEWIRAEYTYECPSHNYLDGWDKTDTIETVYLGPKQFTFMQTMKLVNLNLYLENTSYQMILWSLMKKQH